MPMVIAKSLHAEKIYKILILFIFYSPQNTEIVSEYAAGTAPSC
jgi:hypothetical protein